jgi:hypothetical protein
VANDLLAPSSGVFTSDAADRADRLVMIAVWRHAEL